MSTINPHSPAALNGKGLLHYLTDMTIKDEDFAKAMGQRIAAARKYLKLSQVQLAARLDVPQQTLAHYEVGRTRVPIELLPRMAEVLDVSLDELLIGQPAPRNPGKRGPASRLQQQLAAIDAMPKTAQRTIVDVLDALIVKHTPRAQAGSAEHTG
ncbi:helix-turn-helix domain-containing protein [Asticcacaulis sp. W401b]|uniref:helix-turn-helix domain-containing protein n=1 Tax=Asticcacaulis sp. W401b TaxID=3388666 RepID=UPI00397055FD